MNATAEVIKCRLCTVTLSEDEDDDFEEEVCGSCQLRPEARRLGLKKELPQVRRQTIGMPKQTAARAFTVAEKSMIAKVHGYMPAQQLLDLLNERLVADLGPDATRYSMDQLYAEIGSNQVTPAGGHDYGSLRKLLAKAKREGVLAAINEQVINDFAVVFSLNPKQVVTLKDIVLQSDEDES